MTIPQPPVPQPEIVPSIPPTPAQNPTSPTDKKEASSWFEHAIQRVGKLRDGVLTLGGVLYLSGYFVVQFTALKRNLGLVSLPASQYFIAGFVPVVLFSAFVFSVWLGYRLATRIASWKNSVPELSNRRTGILLGSALIAIIVLFLLSRLGIKTAVPGRPNNWAFGATLLSMLIAYLYCIACAASIISSEERKPNVMQSPLGNKHFWTTVIVIIIVLAVPITLMPIWMSAYGNGVYPNWPQELGGMALRTAHLDVKRSELSPETREALLPKAAQKMPSKLSEDSTPVVQTVLLDVAYDAGEYLLVRPHDKQRISPTYRVKKDVIQGITWYGYRLPGNTENGTSTSKPDERKVIKLPAGNRQDIRR